METRPALCAPSERTASASRYALATASAAKTIASRPLRGGGNEDEDDEPHTQFGVPSSGSGKSRESGRGSESVRAN